MSARVEGSARLRMWERKRQEDALFRSWKSHVGVLALTATMAVPIIGFASPAGAAGADKLPLQGSPFVLVCNTGQVVATPGDFGFAVINAPSNGTVQATVTLKKQTPNATYNVTLLQGAADCLATDATLTTNGQGNGTVQVSEPSVSTHANILILGPDNYVTAAYNHQLHASSFGGRLRSAPESRPHAKRPPRRAARSRTRGDITPERALCVLLTCVVCAARLGPDLSDEGHHGPLGGE